MIAEWDQRSWLKKRKSLQEELEKLEFLKYGRVERSDGMIKITGGSIPIGFQEDGKLFVWSRGGKNTAGPFVYLEELLEAENICLKWLQKQKNEEKW